MQRGWRGLNPEEGPETKFGLLSSLNSPAFAYKGIGSGSTGFRKTDVECSDMCNIDHFASPGTPSETAQVSAEYIDQDYGSHTISAVGIHTPLLKPIHILDKIN